MAESLSAERKEHRITVTVLPGMDLVGIADVEMRYFEERTGYVVTGHIIQGSLDSNKATIILIYED